ncbi:GTP-binding protein Rheb homolog isoform X1 [Anopheles maculipalpis]|uniref:GTP-binding protein Rheb homolog isoform X1 n=1 Tax=Anopheles maculipalpis TaxID=1496333 RepID=UPI00215982B3|nr:GTP-binding protein Rheb homolog isoform X1 [Anopheles maculipalpis]
MTYKQRNLAMMGYRSVGKSSLSIQFVEGQFVDSYDPTIENTFTKKTRINQTDYEIRLVDTAGQDEYSIFPAQYSMDFHGYVLVYSITSQRSFEVIKIIYEKLLDMMGKAYVPVVLVGNKTDLHQERAVPMEEGRKLADSWKAQFLETSAKQNEVAKNEPMRQEPFTTPFSLLLLLVQSVNDVFSLLIAQIERDNGNTSEKSSCTIS